MLYTMRRRGGAIRQVIRMAAVPVKAAMTPTIAQNVPDEYQGDPDASTECI